MNTRHQKPADIYAALRTVNWFVTGKRYRSSGFIALTLVDKRMDTWMLQVLERRRYRRLKAIERNFAILAEHFGRSAQAMCKSVNAFNESIDRMNRVK